MNTMDFVLYKIIRKIGSEFPSLLVEIEHIKETDEYAVAIFDNAIYMSGNYLSLVTDIKLNLLFNNGIFNILFVCNSKKEPLMQINSFTAICTKQSDSHTWETFSDFMPVKSILCSFNHYNDKQSFAA